MLPLTISGGQNKPTNLASKYNYGRKTDFGRTQRNAWEAPQRSEIRTQTTKSVQFGRCHKHPNETEKSRCATRFWRTAEKKYQATSVVRRTSSRSKIVIDGLEVRRTGRFPRPACSKARIRYPGPVHPAKSVRVELALVEHSALDQWLEVEVRRWFEEPAATVLDATHS